MNLSEKASEVIRRLKRLYPEVKCELVCETPFQLLAATRLSAQCTDKRVNVVAAELFLLYPTPQIMMKADAAELESVIRSCGLSNTKTRDLIGMSRRVCEVYGGFVPSGMDELLSLPGVGRKTANLIRGEVFGLPAIVADTHVIRISNRLGFADSDKPVIVERALINAVEPEEQLGFCHRIIRFGRAVCTARKPKCAECPLGDLCGVSTVRVG